MIILITSNVHVSTLRFKTNKLLKYTNDFSKKKTNKPLYQFLSYYNQFQVLYLEKNILHINFY